MSLGPPASLDGATVMAYADVAGSCPTGRTRHVVGGVKRDDFARLVIARYPDADGVYLFYCSGGHRRPEDEAAARELLG
jgi:hypothetical protein